MIKPHRSWFHRRNVIESIVYEPFNIVLRVYYSQYAYRTLKKAIKYLAMSRAPCTWNNIRRMQYVDNNSECVGVNWYENVKIVLV